MLIGYRKNSGLGLINYSGRTAALHDASRLQTGIDKSEGFGVRQSSAALFDKGAFQRFPMQNRCLSERKNNWPLLIAGEAKVVSPSSFFAIGVN